MTGTDKEDEERRGDCQSAITFLHMRTELLAPAGSLDGLKASVNAGADAVYIGGSAFGARAYADNPGEEDLLRGIEYAHLRGAKVYLTVNTLLKEQELAQLADYLLPYVREGLDAVLVQDFGVLHFLRRVFPSLPIHASTQMTVTGPASASLLRSYGVSRVVPARELSLKELLRIKEESGLEVEIFVHGALCYCYSGQCLLSSVIGGRSGNRGRCAQPCRLLNLLNDKDNFRGGESILDRPDARHYMSLKDLCAIQLLPEFVRSGIDSLKIEGRMKRPEYAAGVVSIYRRCLDRAFALDKNYSVSDEEQKALYDLYNRNGFTEGYFHHRGGKEMMAFVKHVLSKEEVTARQALYQDMHERYISKEKPLFLEAVCTVEAGKRAEAELSCEGKTVRAYGDEVHQALKRPLSGERIYENFSKDGGTDFRIRELTVRTDGKSFLPISAINELRRSAFWKMRECLLEPYRRQLDSELVRTAAGSCLLMKESSSGQSTEGKPCRIHVLVSGEEQLDAVLASPHADLVYIEAALLYRMGDPVESALALVRRCIAAGKEAGIALPRIDREGSSASELKEAAAMLLQEGLSVFLVRSLESFADLLQRGLAPSMRLDASLYTFNSEAQEFFRELGTDRDTAPIELNRRELSGRDNRFNEIVAYGYLPLMISAQCLKKNTDSCTKRGDTLTLTDRTGSKFFVSCECVFCYNVLYNTLPLSLLGEGPALAALGFESIRLEFTMEDAELVKSVLAAAGRFRQGREGGLAVSCTKGHFLRGVI